MIRSKNLHLFGPAYETSRTVSGWLKKNKDRVSGYYNNGQFLKMYVLRQNIILKRAQC